MSAHVPRKVFAKSFVVTVAALPIVAACASNEPAPNNPPVPTSSATVEPNMNPPPPERDSTQTAPQQQTGRVETIRYRVTESSGKCQAMIMSTCPPGASCNPPPPTAYVCPKEVPAKSYPIELSPIAGTSNCTTTYEEYFSVTCPPASHCNPPPPQSRTLTVPCPK